MSPKTKKTGQELVDELAAALRGAKIPGFTLAPAMPEALQTEFVFSPDEVLQHQVALINTLRGSGFYHQFGIRYLSIRTCLTPSRLTVELAGAGFRPEATWTKTTLDIPAVVDALKKQAKLLVGGLDERVTALEPLPQAIFHAIKGRPDVKLMKSASGEFRVRVNDVSYLLELANGELVQASQTLHYAAVERPRFYSLGD